MNVTCPQCKTVFRVDPRKVPAAGVRARCSVCGGVFDVQPERQAEPEPAPAVATPAAAGARPEEARPSPPPAAVPHRAGSPFGVVDSEARARRLARALISDLAAYHPERQEQGIREGRLKELFREELKRSWQEYVEQVGLEVARSTPWFREALNEILARGNQVF